MKTNSIIFICIYFTLSAVNAQNYNSSEYIYVSEEGIRRFLRVQFGYSQLSITPKDSSKVMAHCLHLENEVKVVSGFMKKESKIAVHDAFYVEINIGKMTTEPKKTTSYISGEEVESRFSYSTSFGYLGLLGYRTYAWGVLGGMDFRFSSINVGKTNMQGERLFMFNRPIILRGEVCISKKNADRRIIVTVGYDGGSVARNKLLNTRIDLPIDKSGRWWLFGQYTSIEGSSQNLFVSSKSVNSIANQLTLGIRVGNLP